MFTGVIDDIGDFVKAVGTRYTFSLPDGYLQKLEKGGSLGVNGVCLTLVSLDNGRGRVSVDVSAETRARTNIGNLQPGDRVNLELPLEASGLGGRLDGHIVQGHVDTIGKIGKIRRERENHLFRIATSRKFEKYLVEKGAVAVDGISLTPYRVAGGSFTVSVIPHSYENTTLQFKRSGGEVNIEFDILAKYIRNSVRNH